MVKKHYFFATKTCIYPEKVVILWSKWWLRSHFISNIYEFCESTDVCFLTEHDSKLWWYDGERVEFRSENYAKLLMLMASEPVLTLDDMQHKMGINMSAVKKLVNQLVDKHYIERGSADGSWRVFITPSV